MTLLFSIFACILLRDIDIDIAVHFCLYVVVVSLR